ncbi:MAG: NAD(P)/FAD-dependent oxidoreductase [Simkaniaceae bacterium]|nr:NAD(P)/FAD-dependent oxidoreductase [Simkaniaceae bacterium]
MEYDLVIIGGGAAGIFAAIQAKEHASQARVAVIEKTATLLAKVRVSGGGRCNVTHHCFDPKELVKNYPRGHKELLGPFHQFQPKDMIHWLEAHGVEIKSETDGRCFPITDSSQTIIDAFLARAAQLDVEILTVTKIDSIQPGLIQDRYIITLKDGNSIQTKKLLLATGSSKEGHQFAQSFGHSIIPPIPSLFTFNVPSSPYLPLSGIAIPDVLLQIEGEPFSQQGPLLLTHFGFSGPAALKLSAWAARALYDAKYHATLIISWLPGQTSEEIFKCLKSLKTTHPKQQLSSVNPFSLPKKLWKALIEEDIPLAQSKDASLKLLADKLSSERFQIEGKTTNKEEFVTCGGVDLKEVNFKTMESKICPNLYFAGEILDIDGVTGGFNFQNAWTTAYIAAKAALKN